MLRITTIREDEKHCRLKVCGQFTAEYVSEIEKALNEDTAHERVVAVDLTGVTLVDREAMKFLCDAHSRSVAIENIPPYVQRWIQQERACSSTED